MRDQALHAGIVAMVCPHCGTDTPSPAVHCRSCATPLPPLGISDTSETIGTDASVAETFAPGHTGVAATVGPLAPGSSFGTRYRILRVLGAGGMGVVYQAWDAELGVAVALKVIRPEVNADPYAAREVERRFKRELLLARQVTHKHVVRIHDLGEIDGIKYLTMPYIEGRDLARVLREHGRLPVPQALRFAKQVAEGLLAAHEAGVVHRDLKPENVMIDAENQAQIMDFGISRSVSGPGTGTATAVGAVIGTLEYMAPEQARGVAVDHRADIYSFGLIVHDMLIGRRRLTTSDSALAEMMSRMHQPPESLRTQVSDVPEDLDRIVARCLQPDPAQRYATTADLVADLNALDADGRAVRAKPSTVGQWKVATAALVVLLVIVGGLAVFIARNRGPAAAAPARDPVSVLIADFDNRTGDQVFEGSIEQALGIGIEGASFITSFPRRDALRAAQQIGRGPRIDEETARLISQSQGIKVVLAGLVAGDGNGYRITVRTLDPIPGREISSVSRTARTKGEVLQVASALASDVRRALGDTTSESARLAADETFTSGSLEACKAYANAQQLATANRDEEAIAEYKRAIALDPKFGRAYSGWATSAWKLGRREEAEQQYQQAFAHANRMTEREKFRTYGAYYTSVAANYQKGIESFSTLVSKYPADTAAHNNLAVAYFNLLQFQKALAEGRQLTENYPMSVLYRENYALYAMYAGDFALARQQANEAVKLNPNTSKAYFALALASLAQGDAAGARQTYERMLKGDARGVSLGTMGLADLALYEGRQSDAIALLGPGAAADEANRFTAAAAAKHIALAEAHLARGDTRDAVGEVDAATRLSRDSSVLVPAAVVLVRAGREPQASAIAEELSTQLQSHGRTFSRLVQAQLALKHGKAVEAANLLDVTQVEDLWLVRFYRAVAYLSTGNKDGPPLAASDLEKCEQRIGEATAVFLDDTPSFRYTVPLQYWRGRQREGMGQGADASADYAAFLKHQPPDARDPLSIDARRRLDSR